MLHPAGTTLVVGPGKVSAFRRSGTNFIKLFVLNLLG